MEKENEVGVTQFIQAKARVCVYGCLTAKLTSSETTGSPDNQVEMCVFHFSMRKVEFREVK